LEVPSFKFHSNTRPSMFDYPPEQEVKAEEAPEKVKTAVLSTTAQAKRRKLVKARQQRRESMDIDQTPTTPKISNADDDKMDIDDDSSKGKDEKADKSEGEKEGTPSTETLRKKVEKEKVGYEMENMSRVLTPQVKYITFPEERYVAVKKATGGVIVLEDTQPSEPKTLLELKVKKTAPAPAPGAPGLSDRITDAYATRDSQTTSTNSGAAEAAAVLNAVDEDDEDGEEAEIPGEFDYITDDERDDEE